MADERCGKFANGQWCHRPAKWRGIVGNLNVFACDEHKDDSEIGAVRRIEDYYPQPSSAAPPTEVKYDS